jgi:F0F1-type ATP synthase alpha subunit
MSLVQLIEKVAKKYNIKVNSLPNGVIILVKNGIAFVQIAAVRNVYYIRYLTKDEAYIVDKLDEEIVELVILEKLDESKALKIPDI